MSEHPSISAIVPSWNALRYVPACLAALQAQLGPDDEIVLVDNGSRDGVAAWARLYAPAVRLVVLPQNLGFAGGTNAGIAAAHGELLLLCNDDALVEPGCVTALRAALQGQADIGAVGGVLTFSRHPEIVASAGICVRRDGVALDVGLGEPVTSLLGVQRGIFGASGGLALLRRTLIEDIGGFAAAFFNYLEDVDLAWRARLRGWDCCLAPAARARHVYSASAGQGSPLKQRLLGRNRLRVLVRCLPAPLLRECWPAIVRYDALALAYAALRHQPAIMAGRLMALNELPDLLAQRRLIQARRTVAVGDLAHWLEPAPVPWHALRLQQRLDHLVAFGT